MSSIVSSVLVPSKVSTRSKTTTRTCSAAHGPKTIVSDSSKTNLFNRAEKLALAVSTSVLTSTYPALAIVDDRLNGDGTGLPLGINDGALGIVLGTVPLAIFALYFTAGKQDGEIIAGGKDDDSGLSL
jgi:photosystem II PsbW protein